MNRARARLLVRLLGPLLLLAILTRIDVPRLYAELRHVRVFPLLWIVIPLVLSLLVKGRRWNRLVAGQGRPESTLHSTHVYAVGVFYGMLTPGRVGEVWKASVLSRRGVPLSSALALCVLDRLLDLGCMALLALGLLLPHGTAWILGLWLAGAAFVILFLHAWQRSAPFFARLLLRRDTAVQRPGLPARHAPEIALWSLVFWILYFWQIGGLLLAAGYWLPPATWIPAVAGAAIAAMLPVSFMGLGTREAALLAFLVGTGLPREGIVFFSLLYLYIYLVGAGIGWLLSLAPLRDGLTTAAD